MSRTEKTEPTTPTGEPGPGRSCWWKRRGLRIAAVFLVAVVALTGVARMALPPVLVAIGNRKLAEHLVAPATLSGVDIGIFDYCLTVQDLSISQPDGLGGGLLLDLPEARVSLALSSLFGSPLAIEDVMITDLSLHVRRDRDGTLNVVRLHQPAANDPEAAGPPKPVHIKRITVKRLTLRYADLALSEEPVDVTINRFDAVVTDVYLNTAGSGGSPLPGRAEMTGHFIQPNFSDAPLGIAARFGPIGTRQPIPAAYTAVCLAGVELQPWDAFLPRGTLEAIGGDIIDVRLHAAVGTESLDCTVAFETPAGDALKLNVGGTPRRPQVGQDGIWGNVSDRAREAGLNTVGNMGDAGEELGRTILSSAAVACRGVATTVW